MMHDIGLTLLLLLLYGGARHEMYTITLMREDVFQLRTFLAQVDTGED